MTPGIQTVGVIPQEMLQGHEEAPSEATQMLIKGETVTSRMKTVNRGSNRI